MPVEYFGRSARSAGDGGGGGSVGCVCEGGCCPGGCGWASAGGCGCASTGGCCPGGCASASPAFPTASRSAVAAATVTARRLITIDRAAIAASTSSEKI